MQNLDFYFGKTLRDIPPQFGTSDPEYFSRLANVHANEENRQVKRAHRILSLIIALCIVSFTTGLVIGIKFAGGESKPIVDNHTREAVSNFGHKVSSLINKGSTELHAETKNNLFSKDEYPYIIKIGNDYNKTDSQEIASILSSRGHTVILSKHNSFFRIYVGPYNNEKQAQIIANVIKSSALSKKYSDAIVIKR